MKLCWFGSCCFSAVSSWGGWVGACFLPARSLRPWACLHVGLISVLWSSFPFLHVLHLSLFSACLYWLWCIAAHLLHGFLCWVSSSPILTTGHVSVYVRFLLIFEGNGVWPWFVFPNLSSIVYVLCMKFDRGVWITFWMIFCRFEESCKL